MPAVPLRSVSRYNRAMNAICLVVDRLHAGYVGAYGNTWIETPWLDRLASQSIVFDQCLIEGPQLEGLCRSYWQGWHPLLGSNMPDERSALPSLLAAAGVTTTLLTDEPAVARHPLSRAFDSVVELHLPEFAQVADQIEEWADATGIDGFNLTYALSHETMERVVELLVPELQRRGRYATDYTPGTLRHKLFRRGPRLPASHTARTLAPGGPAAA